MKGVKGSGTPRVKKQPHAGRPKEEASKPFYCRLKVRDWEKLKALGGKDWLIKQLRESS